VLYPSRYTKDCGESFTYDITFLYYEFYDVPSFFIYAIWDCDCLNWPLWRQIFWRNKCVILYNKVVSISPCENGVYF